MKTNFPLYKVPTIQSLQDMVFQSCRTYGDKLALEDLNPTPIPRVTYNGLLEHILKFGSALRAHGIKERTHIAVIGENRIQWGLTYLTSACFNYVIVPIDKNLTQNEILNIVNESDAEVVVTSQLTEPIFRESGSSLKKVRHFISMDLPRASEGFLSMTQMMAEAPPFRVTDLPVISPNEMSAVLFTSGTLGRAKGVMLSQRNIAANLMDMLSMLMMYPEDRFLSVLPIHHTYECNCGFLCPLFAGSSIHYARSLKTVADDLRAVRATILLAVPLLYDKVYKRIIKGISEKKSTAALVPALIAVTDMLSKAGLKQSKKKVFAKIHETLGGSLRVMIAGGAAQDPIVARGFREFGFNFLQGYGLTETSPILTLNRLEAFKDDAAGLPLPNVRLRINNPDAEGVGEVYAQGPNVMLGYYKNEDATRNVFDDGWFTTGDLGVIDEDGFLHIKGRKKNVIISKSGKNIYPEEIEDLLNHSPFVLESMVYGEKDPKQDEIVAAQIVVDGEAFIELTNQLGVRLTDELIRAQISDVVQKANAQLPSFKQIRKFTIRQSEFQKTTTQKIKRFAHAAEA